MAQNIRTFPGAVSLALLPLLLLLASCQPKITEQGKRQLLNAAKLVEEGSYVPAIDELERFIDTYPSSHEAAEAYYMLGLSRLQTDDSAQAEQNFESALSAAEVPVLEYYVRMSLANLAFERQDYSRAGKYYGRYLDELPHKAPFYLAYYRYGMSLQALGRWKQADVQFSRVLYLFPQADILRSVQERFGRTHYAIEIGRFSSFELAGRQREEFSDLVIDLPQVRRSTEGWCYVNLYGNFSNLAQAEQALEQIRPRVSQARIVP
ncbi:MAG: tetratricopeptide repeat protein [Actinobacteria bacterium]|nr:tetratricopeptide repeat protein [Actinomycetota bacterium]